MIKKYAVEDNCWAKLETSIDATATKIRIKESHNLPQSGEWIATLVKKQGDEIIKMEKVLVVKRELNLLTVQRGFQSTAQAWEENDVINLYITAEIIREIQRGFDKKADLVNGKVPASQLPEMQAIDESNLVHKSGDEVIGGNKTFTGEIKVQSDLVLAPNIDFNNSSFSFGKRGDPTNIRGIERWAQANGKDASIYFTDYFSSTPTRLEHRCKQLWGYLKVGNQTRTFDRFQVRGYEGFDGSEASLQNVKKYIKLNAPKIYLEDGIDLLGEWQQRTPTNGASTITSHHCRYKKIGKTCHFIAQVYVNNVAGKAPGFTLPIPRANYGTEFVVAGYCVRRGENPATKSRGAISFSGRDSVFTLGSTDVSAFTQPGEYIIRASGTYETE